MSAIALCCLHLPGNVQCPYPALYVVSWNHNEPAAYEKKPPEYRRLHRLVCVFHLEAGIRDALELAPGAEGVEVNLR